MKKSLITLVVIFLLSGCSQTQKIVETAKKPTPSEVMNALIETNKKAVHENVMPIEDYPPEISSIINRGEIIFAMVAADQKPFFYKDEKTGEFLGIDVEIAYEIANTLGVKPRFDRTSKGFNDVVIMVAKGEADIALSKLSKTLKRGQFVRYTKPYITFRQALLFNRLELTKVTTEDALPDFVRNVTGTIGVQAGSYSGYAKANFPKAKVVEFSSWDDAISGVLKGDVLAVYRDELEILKITAQKKDAALTLKPVILVDKQDPIAMAVSADAPILQEWLDIFLAEYIFAHKDELNAQSLVDRYFTP